MTELVKKQKVDLNKFEVTLVDGIKLSGDGKLYALPVTNMVQVLFYNKSIFDKFGVPYPKNGMSWDETMEIARKMTRQEDGKQYLGFLSSPAHMLRGNQLSQSYLDPATDKPTFLNETWKSLIQTYFLNPAADERYKNRVTELKRFPTRTHFTETQEFAMFVFNSQFPFTVPKDMAKIQWDLVSLPTLKEKPNIGSAATPFTMGIASISRNKEAALRVIDFLTSRDIQIEYSKQGIMPVIQDGEVKKAYGQSSDFKDKNWSAVFHNQYAPMGKFSRYHLAVENILNTVPLDAIMGSKDLNTALREATEEAEKAIAEMKSGK
jgi:multiple sugar transport system substrate-binding protein